MSLRIACVGGTGETGRLFLKQALSKGNHVTALVRDVHKAKFEQSPLLSVVAADVFDHKSMAPQFKDHDVVVSTLGFPKPAPDAAIQTTELFSSSMEEILKAMEASNIRRMVTISAWFTDPGNRENHKLYTGMWTKIPGLTAVLDNEGEMEQVLAKHTGNIDYTSVRPPFLTWDESTGKQIETAFGKNWVNGVSDYIPRADVARYMLDCIPDKSTFGKCVSIGVKMTEEESREAGERLMAR
eukprot:CAMPEP_0203751318 /NCGR_PEP_ID=MMETSP0098-20131031/5411_1 /ASSEMBLY_ACC=CAM_ASM_000208 /TAXON_ID=96639 /ORGANISM=" , Strain NY0313808BC1" /LENGTH=240 /DNA_ID=CAMNT_0050640983 /DNA_START=64 /DNA_END=783 /DNA_ORIENTATION=-